MFELLLILLIVLGFWVVLTYNRLVALRNRVKNAWAQIDVQLRRRYDLIPNLVETVKGYAKHEKKVFTEVAKLRSQIVTGTPEQRAKANDMLSNALKSIFAVAENYPELKANENFKMLQEELAGTEDKIAYIRTAYNDTVYEYNTALQMFPTNIIANILGFKPEGFFKTEGESRKAVKVKFD